MESRGRSRAAAPREELGRKALNLFASARKEVTLVAPFVTYPALRRLLDSCPEGVPIRVAARFLPEDILAGVCDPDAARLLLDHPHVDVFCTHPSLHGKLYRADDRCLVGSANVTNRALGWGASSNLELMLELEVSETVRTFEQDVFEHGDPMTDHRLRDLVARAREMAPDHADLVSSEPKSLAWLPTCRNPQALYDVYARQDEWKILESVLSAARRDLTALAPIPRNLDRTAFEAFVAQALRRHPLVYHVELTGVADPEQTRAAIEETSRQLDTQLSGPMLWEVLQEWLLYFLGDQFRSVAVETRLVAQRRI